MARILGSAWKASRMMDERRRARKMTFLVTIAAFLILVALALVYLKMQVAVGIAVLGVLAAIVLPRLVAGPSLPNGATEGTDEAVGHGTVRSLLAQLSDDYAIFVGLHRKKGDCDYLVVGPTGLFVIEVKSRTGIISVGWESLLINEYQPERDFIDQALSHAVRIRRLLGDLAVPEDALAPVLVFTRASVPPMPPLRGVHVLKSDGLLDAILTAPACDLPVTQIVDQIEHALAKEK